MLSGGSSGAARLSGEETCCGDCVDGGAVGWREGGREGRGREKEVGRGGKEMEWDGLTESSHLGRGGTLCAVCQTEDHSQTL